MKAAFYCLSALLFVGACATSSPIGDGLQALRGQDIRMAIEYLGYPDVEQEIVGDTVYTWFNDGLETSFFPVKHQHASFRRGNQYRRDRDFIPQLNSYSCLIRIATRGDNIIRHTEARSTGGGCYRYTEAFQEIVDDLGADEALSSEKLEN